MTTETMDTQTPRTDAEQKWIFGDNRPGMSFECVKVEFAQELEKELAQAKRLLATRVEASRLDDAERRFQYQKDENDNRIKQIRKLQQELHELHTKDSARTREYNTLVQENRDLHKQLADSPKMLGMVTDLNMMLQNKADMWRDEFARIKALCHGKPLEWLEVAGICDRAMSDIRSNISLIDQREKAADEIARLRDYIDHAQRTLNAALSASENSVDH